jgi:hypothetical protein
MRALQTRLGATDCVIHQQHDYRSHCGDAYAVKIYSADAAVPQEAYEPSSDDGADDPQNNIDDQSVATLIHDLAADESGDQAEDDPSLEKTFEPPLL